MTPTPIAESLSLKVDDPSSVSSVSVVVLPLAEGGESASIATLGTSVMCPVVGGSVITGPGAGVDAGADVDMGAGAGSGGGAGAGVDVVSAAEDEISVGAVSVAAAAATGVAAMS